jgi:enoyl reductase
MSKAVVFTEYGGPDVLTVIDTDTPTPGPKQIRVRVKAAGVQPFDCLFRSGAARQWVPATFPQRLGNEFAGVVDALGEGVAAVAVGDEVIGWAMLGSIAEHVVVPAGDIVAKPASMPWSEAGALSASGQTASTALDRLRITSGDTVLIHAAAGGVGSFAVQIARARGATVIGTASVKNHDYLRSLGATPVLYGDGLVERVRAAAPGGIDAALVAVGSDEALHASIELVHEKSRVATVAFQPLADKLGIARVTTERSSARLSELTQLYANGKLGVSIQTTYRFEQAADAHRAMETGHVRGKIAFVA